MPAAPEPITSTSVATRIGSTLIAIPSLSRPHAEERSEAARLEAWAAPSFETTAARSPQDEAERLRRTRRILSRRSLRLVLLRREPDRVHHLRIGGAAAEIAG